MSKDYEIFEEPIGLVQMTKTDAATIFAALKDVPLHCILPVNSCRGQAHDGASVMSGHLHGGASRFKEEEPAALYVHCLAHSLNLCLQDASQLCSAVHDSLELVMEIVKTLSKAYYTFQHNKISAFPWDTKPQVSLPYKVDSA